MGSCAGSVASHVTDNVFIGDNVLCSRYLSNQNVNQALALQKRGKKKKRNQLPGFTLQYLWIITLLGSL